MKQLQKYGATERFYTESKLYPDYQLARVIAQYRGKYKVITDQQEFFAEISGKFRYTTEELVQFPTVGDFVMVTVEKEFASIHQVLTRKSLFLRKAVGVSNQSQTVAANIDTVFLCMSLNKNFNLNRMERYLSIAWDSGATPVIVLTKSDLCEDLSERISQIESISCFSDIIVTSMFEDDISAKFLSYFSKNQTCAFIGSSGVGKSTLINRLLGVNTIATQEIAKGDKGRHTTTGREMFLCPLGGVVIDTPGMEHLKTLAVQDQPSLFVWAKNMADMAMRAIIYVETEYPQELERKNSFVEQSKEEQKTEPDTTEQMELEMGG